MCIIYIVVIPHLSRVPQLRRSIKSHNPLCVSAKHTPRGEGRYGLIYCLVEIRQFENSQHLSHFTTRGIDTSLPRQIPHDVISARHCSDLYPSVCLSVSVSPFHIPARAPACVHAHGDVRRRHVDFYLRLPLSRCAEILSWITINLSQ